MGHTTGPSGSYLHLEAPHPAIPLPWEQEHYLEADSARTPPLIRTFKSHKRPLVVAVLFNSPGLSERNKKGDKDKVKLLHHVIALVYTALIRRLEGRDICSATTLGSGYQGCSRR